MALLLLCSAPAVVRAAGGSPADPIGLAIDGASRGVSLHPARPHVWLRVSGDPEGISHLDVETTGDADTLLFVYRNLADAQADRPFAEDDDSGAGRNAKVHHFLGYSLPWLVKVALFRSSDSATTSLRATSSFAEPAVCSGTGPCSFAVSARGREGGRELLATMRGVRNFVLQASPRGGELVELYYRLSAAVVVDVVTDSLFRQRLFDLGTSLLPEIRQALAAGVGDRTDLLVTEEAVTRARELSQLLSERIPASLRAPLEEWTLALEAEVGRPIQQAMRSLELLPEAPSGFTLPAGSAFPVKRGELLVKLRSSPTVSPPLVAGRLLTGSVRVDSILAGFSIDSVEPLFGDIDGDANGLGRVLRLRLASHRAPALRRQLLSSDEVEWAEPVSVAYLASEDLYAEFQYGPEAVGAPAVWEIPATGAPPMVAIIDTGIDGRQADLAGRTRTDLGRNFFDPSKGTRDDHGHGTHVAGTVAAAIDNLYSVAGLCGEAQVIPYKVCGSDGSCTWDAVASAIVAAAAAGARVVNMSLGGPFSQVVEDALEHAYGLDVLLVAAAGNDGQEGSSFPGSSRFTLSVGATDEQNNLASFSNWGDLDLTAPGVDIVNLSIDGESCFNSGTSMASPHVAGVAALLASRLPGTTRAELTRRLRLGATDLGDPGPDPLFGAGLVNADTALRKILAVHWPLAGKPPDRGVNSPFAADWVASCEGLVKRHTGLDLQAVAGEKVYAAHYGTVRAVPNGGTTWARAVTIESPSRYTTVYWHIDPVVGVGDKVSIGQKIGTVADLAGRTHLHFGSRRGSYVNLSNRGSLPQQACGTDPPFPAAFFDPEKLRFGHLLITEDVPVSRTVVACNTIGAGEGLRVKAPAHLVLRGGSAVALRNGFVVENNARLTVELDPPTNCP